MAADPSAAKERAAEAIARRERVIREYQLRARAAVLVLSKHGLEEEYLNAYRELHPPVAADRLPDPAAGIVYYDLVLNEKIVGQYDTREEAQDAQMFYVATYGPPVGAFYVEERHES